MDRAEARTFGPQLKVGKPVEVHLIRELWTVYRIDPAPHNRSGSFSHPPIDFPLRRRFHPMLEIVHTDPKSSGNSFQDHFRRATSKNGSFPQGIEFLGGVCR